MRKVQLILSLITFLLSITMVVIQLKNMEYIIAFILATVSAVCLKMFLMLLDRLEEEKE